MGEYVAQANSVKMILDALMLSAKMNSIGFQPTRKMEIATTFPDEFVRHLPGLKDAPISGAGNADYADDENNEQLYARLSTEDSICTIAAGGAVPGDVAYFQRVSEVNFTPLKADPGKVCGYDFSMVRSKGSEPLVRGLILEDGSRILSTPVAPSATLASPAAPGNIDDGTHSWKQTFVSALGESAPSAKSNVITIADKTVNGQVDVTLAIGPIGTTSRKLYRSDAGDAGPWQLVTTIANNTSTTYRDNIADSATTVAAPSTGSFTGSQVVQLGAAPSGDKLYAVLHVIEAGSGTLTVTIQSDDNSGMSSPATVFAFTAATGKTQEIKSGSSNLQSYYRAIWTITSGAGWKFFIALGYEEA